MTDLTPGGLPAGQGSSTPPRRTNPWTEVPWRTIVAAIGAALTAVVLIDFILLAERILILTAIAGMFAIVLAPPVRVAAARLHLHRGLAIALVVLAVFGGAIGLLALFLLPVRTQLVAALTDLPGTVRQAADGKGPVGSLVVHLHLEQLVEDNKESLTRTAESMQRSLPSLVGKGLEVLLEMITVLVMTALMLSQSALLSRTSLKLVPARHRTTVAAVSQQAAAAVSGYIIGNLIISVCAGGSALVLLIILGVPNPVIIALWVAFADLIPLVGATLGAIVAVVAAFFVSSTAGIVAVVFFVLYQQFENSVLQVVVMSRTVKVNPLAVLLSVLVGVELFGFVGALLAVPIAGAASVVVKEVWRHRASETDQLVLVSDRGVPLDPTGTGTADTDDTDG